LVKKETAVAFDTAGQHFTPRIPHQIELGFSARFQAASLLAAEKRRSNPDPELAGAMFAERIIFAWTEKGKLSLVVSSPREWNWRCTCLTTP
jgi:hypothetical protein